MAQLAGLSSTFLSCRFHPFKGGLPKLSHYCTELLAVTKAKDE